MKKNILYIFFILFSASVFGRTIIVSDENDKRLLAFIDSLECYKFGLWQSENIKKIQCSVDGQIFLMNVTKYQNEIAGKYVTRAIHIEAPTFLFADSKGQHFWSVWIFKKPVDTVIYKEPANTGIWMPSGKIMSKHDFIDRYGKENYDRLIH